MPSVNNLVEETENKEEGTLPAPKTRTIFKEGCYEYYADPDVFPIEHARSMARVHYLA